MTDMPPPCTDRTTLEYLSRLARRAADRGDLNVEEATFLVAMMPVVVAELRDVRSAMAAIEAQAEAGRRRPLVGAGNVVCLPGTTDL